MSLLKVETRKGRKYLKLVQPANLEPLGEVPCLGPEGVAAAVAKAREAQGAWGARSVRARARVLAGVRDALLARLDEAADLIHRETGKPRIEAQLADGFPGLDAIDFVLARASSILADEPIRMRRRNFWVRSRLVHEPRGVIGIISPWNYPLGIPASEAVLALAAGNAVVLKPSEHTPLTALFIEEVFQTGGIPEGVFQVVVGDGETGRNLVESAVDAVAFTGSVATGKRVHETAGRKLIPVVLELGGSDPMLVLSDANVEAAASGAVWGRFTNCGQTCAAVKRVFVEASVAEPFVRKVVEKTRALIQGEDTRFEVDVGPVVSAPQLDIIEEQVRDAVRRGARVAAGGKRPRGKKGYYFEPTVLLDVPAEARVLREETFGPVLPIVTVPDEEEAIRRANDTPFGLSASVWTRSRRRADRVARRLEAGSIFVNDGLFTYGVCETPWGGFKESGLGKTHSAEGLLEFTRTKQIARNLLPNPKPWWFPYHDGEDRYAVTKAGFEGLYRGKWWRLLGVTGSLRRAARRATAAR